MRKQMLRTMEDYRKRFLPKDAKRRLTDTDDLRAVGAELARDSLAILQRALASAR